jgi:ABC-type nitrate/sulfonate/bicarbonate transport system ATPase subunit
MNYQIKETLLTVKDLVVAYGPKVILNHINIEIHNITRPGVKQGQVVCLLGPSGIGKTQLFKCIAGLQKPTLGSIVLNSTNQTVKPGDVGVVFQSYPLLKHRTVGGNLKFAADKVGKTKEEIEVFLNKFDLAKVRDSYPIQLSGGQRQRTAIIQQLLCSSHFILMDEPFSGLDILMKRKTMEVITNISLEDELNTIIITTHDINTAVALADTIWMLGKSPDGVGATIVKSINLMDRGLAWMRPDSVELHSSYKSVISEIKGCFV